MNFRSGNILKSNRNFKKYILVIIVSIVYALYTRPAKLDACLIPDKIDKMYATVEIYKKGFTQGSRQTIFIEEPGKLKPVLEFLNQYLFRKKIHNAYQEVGAAQKETIRIMFHYKEKNDALDVDIFEIGNEGKIRIAKSLHGNYVPYTMGWFGNKQEVNLHRDLLEMLNNTFENDLTLDYSDN